MKQRDRETAIWLFCFIFLMGLFYWLDHNNWYQTVFLEHLARFNARVVTWTLSFLGLDTGLAGATLTLPSGTIEIAESCTGSFVFMIFAAAIIPFPAPWKSRLIGLFSGLAALLALNLFRIFIIVFIASRFPKSLWTLHTIVGQLIVISGMLLCFFWWIKKSQKGGLFAFAQSKALIFKTILLFILGYLGAYWLYGAFLNSGPGIFVKQRLELHTMFLIKVINAVIFSGESFRYAAPQVKLIEGCLSSPMVVLFAAIVFAWPAKWWKKLLILVIGFVPFFYLYHLIRAVLISTSMGFNEKQTDIVYNLYGQVMLALALFAITANIWKHKWEQISYISMLCNFLKGMAIGIFLGVALGQIGRRIFIPHLTSGFNGHFYDPQQSISLMPDLQLFVWATLLWLTPGLSPTKKWITVVVGAIAILIIFSAILVINTIFRLAPHVGLIKLGVVIVPFLIYTFLFIKLKIQAHGNTLEKL